MVIRYSSLNRMEKPQFTLCNPGSIYKDGLLTKVVGILTDTEAEEIVFNFNATSEFNLRINRITRDDPIENAHVYSVYKAVQNRRLIFVDDIGYFMITNIEDGFDGHNHYKDVTAKSVDAEISQKMVPFIDNNTYRFSTDGTGTNKGMLETIVEALPLWTIGHVDNVVAERWRTFEDIDTSLNCLAFMLQNMQDAYECLFIYNIVTRTISVYDQANYVRQTNIHITKEDLINSLDITENADDLFTAVSVLGDDNVTIAAINPLGTNVIYDFTYYLSWMSDSLGAKVVQWQKAVDAEREPYYNLNLDYFKKMTEAFNIELETEKLDTQITMYYRCRNNIVAENSTDLVGRYNEAIAEAGGEEITIQDSIKETLAVIDNLIAECESNKENNQAIHATKLAELETIKTQVNAVHEKLKITSYFTEEEYAELCHYIFEGSYSDDYVVITDIMSYDDKFAQMKILYDRAVSQLQRASRPTQEFNVDVENFIFIKEFEEWSAQLETGCLINVELDVNDIAALFLSSMTINYDDHTLKMTFGNRFNKFDPKSLYDDVLGKITKSANTLAYIKEILYPIKSGEFNSMKESMRTSRNLTMGAALASDNQSVIIDGSGYTGRQLLDNGTYDPRQVKIVNNSIVFTDDAWAACEVALGEIVLGDGTSTYGLNAKTLIGEMIVGGQLNIYDKDGNELLSVVNNQIQLKVSESVGSAEKALNDRIERVQEGLSSNIDMVTERVSNLEVNTNGISMTVSDVKSSSIISTEEQFYQSTSSVVLEGGSWSGEQPKWADGLYIWRRTKITKGNGVILYSPSETGVCITGNTGAPGSDGSPGADGKTTYVHIKYSDDGKTFTDNNGETLGAWIGTLTDFNSVDSTNFDDYTWKKFTEDVDDEISSLDESIGFIRKSISALAVQDDSIRASVSGLVGIVDKTNGELLQTSQKITSVNHTAEELQIKIEKINNDGVAKVSNTTGTFNEDGLEIDSTSSTTKTQITPNGMEVYRKSSSSESPVLSATDAGVDATNLHAKTYLIIGGRSRFENYGNDRTGCFWIGDVI